MAGYGPQVPPVPGDKLHDQQERDKMLKEYLEKLRAKVLELEARIIALGG